MVGTIIGKILDGGSKILDEVITNDKERLTLLQELRALELRDRDSARDMYKTDDTLQKIYALVFLVSYMILVLAMFLFIYQIAANKQDCELPDWSVAFLSTLFGAMSTKVGTITDFLFGGSKSAEIAQRKKGERNPF